MKISILALSILCVLGVGTSFAKETAQKHVVLIVWDGMRPDYVSEKNTPVLWDLAKKGVTFTNHHPVYPSATNVNGTALVTGVYPGHSGILANHEYRPEIDNRKAIDVENPNVVQKGDEISGGKYVAFPTISEIVRGASPSRNCRVPAGSYFLSEENTIKKKRSFDAEVNRGTLNTG